MHALPAISADAVDEFYFEVTIDSDDSGSSIGVGLCAASAFSGTAWLARKYQLHPQLIGANSNMPDPVFSSFLLFLPGFNK